MRLTHSRRLRNVLFSVVRITTVDARSLCSLTSSRLPENLALSDFLLCVLWEMERCAKILDCFGAI